MCKHMWQMVLGLVEGSSPPQWWAWRGEEEHEKRKDDRDGGQEDEEFSSWDLCISCEWGSDIIFRRMDTGWNSHGGEWGGTWPLEELLSQHQRPIGVEDYEYIGSTIRVPYSYRICSQYATHPKIGLAVVNRYREGCQREQYCSVSSQRWCTPEGNRSKVEAMGVEVKRKESHRVKVEATWGENIALVIHMIISASPYDIKTWGSIRLNKLVSIQGTWGRWKWKETARRGQR